MKAFLCYCPVSLVCIPKQVIVDFQSKLSYGMCLGSPHRIMNMDLPEIMVLLDAPLKESDCHNFWNLRDKAIKHPEFLFEMAEKLPVVPFQLSVRLKLVM